MKVPMMIPIKTMNSPRMTEKRGTKRSITKREYGGPTVMDRIPIKAKRPITRVE